MELTWERENIAPDPSGDFVVAASFEQPQACRFVVEVSPSGSVACALIARIDPAAVSITGRLSWPQELTSVQQIPDSLREIAGEHQTTIFAFLKDELKPSSEASLTVALNGQSSVFRAPPLFVQGTVLHSVAAAQAVTYLLSGSGAATPQRREGEEWVMCTPQPFTAAALKERITALSVLYGVESPYTAFFVDDQGGSPRKALLCRHTSSAVASPVLLRLQQAGPPTADRTGLPRRSTLCVNERTAAVAQSLRKELMKQGLGSVAEGFAVEQESRVMKNVPLPEMRKLDSDMIYRDADEPSVPLLKQHFIKEGRITVEAALRIVSQATAILKKEKNLIELDIPITICGDLHGQYYDLVEMFRVAGMPSSMNKFVFLGDYGDRGWFSTEVLLLLCAVKIATPNALILLRGNHECRSVGKNMTFEDECIEKYEASVFDAFQLLFDALPLAALIKGTDCGKCLCIHGGIGPTLKKIKDIEKISRFQEIPLDGAFSDMMWSDPVGEWKDFPRMSRSQWENLDYSFNTTRRSGQFYGPKAVRRFLADNDIGCIIRGHQVFMDGFMEHFGKDDQHIAPVVTVFSAPNYAGKYGNKGAYMRIERDGGFKVHKFDEATHPFVLPYYCDALTWSLPLLCVKLEEIVHALMQLQEDETITDAEKKADEALSEKFKELAVKTTRKQEQRKHFLEVSQPSYHKNMRLFEKILAEDAVNEAAPERRRKDSYTRDYAAKRMRATSWVAASPTKKQ